MPFAVVLSARRSRRLCRQRRRHGVRSTASAANAFSPVQLGGLPSTMIARDVCIWCLQPLSVTVDSVLVGSVNGVSANGVSTNVALPVLLLMHVAQLGRQHDGFFVVPRGPLGSVLNELVFVRLLQLEPRKHHLQALTDDILASGRPVALAFFFVLGYPKICSQ